MVFIKHISRQHLLKKQSNQDNTLIVNIEDNQQCCLTDMNIRMVEQVRMATKRGRNLMK